jgi:hypothetical protein
VGNFSVGNLKTAALALVAFGTVPKTTRAAMIENVTVRITEAELARDVRAVLDKVQQGNE